MAIEFVDLAIKMVIFHGKVLVYQRVPKKNTSRRSDHLIAIQFPYIALMFDSPMYPISVDGFPVG